MAIYELTSNHFKAVSETSFDLEQLRERSHLQRMLREKVETVSVGAVWQKKTGPTVGPARCGMLRLV